jgi:hypothetical protein
MKKLRVCAILLIGFMIMGGTALAYNSTDHVKAAPGGKGDLIIFPWYYTAGGGWETKLSVINTSNTYSTVAKVVVRSHNYSEEVLDFLVYLSPNDVWTGFLRNDVTGTILWSNDDSVLRRTPGAIILEADFASTANPVSQPLFAVSCPTVDSNAYGYVEVIESAATTGLTKITGTNKVAKTTIYSWYTSYVKPGDGTDTPNILTGYQEFRNSSSGMYDAFNRAEMFADWNNTTKLDVSAVTGLTAPSRNTIGELEAAMSKMNVALPYLNSANGDTSLHIFNFPTKLSWEESQCTSYRAFSDSAYFKNLVAKCEDYMPNVYDLMEATPTATGSPFSGGDPGTNPQMCQEVELIQTTFTGDIFREGWIRYNWATTATPKAFVMKSGSLTNSYTGTPVLSTVLYFKTSAASQTAAAFDDGVVTVSSIVLPYYQYSQYMTPAP